MLVSLVSIVAFVEPSSKSCCCCCSTLFCDKELCRIMFLGRHILYRTGGCYYIYNEFECMKFDLRVDSLLGRVGFNISSI